MANDVKLDYAGFWIRIWAALLDLLVFILVTVPLLYAIHGRGYFQCAVTARGPVDFLNMFVLPNLMVPLFWLLCGATPGKLAVGLKIVDAKTGKTPRPRQVLLRLLGCYLSMLPLGLGVFWIVVDRKKRGWHDRIAGTVVVRVKKPVSL